MAYESKDLCVRLLAKAGVPVDGDEPWSLRVHDKRFYDRVLVERELGMGESYMDGWWDCDDLAEMLTRVLTSDIRSELNVNPRLALQVARAYAVNRQTRRRAAANAHAHYDIGNDLYERMLDKRMIYSCAYWKGARDLDTAQEQKLDLICRKLHLEPGMRVLDIGCGWGGFAQYAAEVWGAHVTGISPAIEQVNLARSRCEGLPVDIHQRDYRDVTGRFDRIISVGMMEHVGPRNYRTFFEACDSLLAPDGIMLHHTIGSTVSKHSVDPFFDKYIFPGGVLPSIAQLGKAIEKLFVLEDLHSFGPYYERTLLAWHDNIEDSWGALPHYDARFRRMWRYYLLASAAGFRARNLQLWQLVFRRTGRAPVYESIR